MTSVGRPGAVWQQRASPAERYEEDRSVAIPFDWATRRNKRANCRVFLLCNIGSPGFARHDLHRRRAMRVTIRAALLGLALGGVALAGALPAAAANIRIGDRDI